MSSLKSLQWKYRGPSIILHFESDLNTFTFIWNKFQRKLDSKRRRTNMMMSSGTTMGTLEFIVDDDRCYGCGACIGLCPTNALSMKELLAIVEQELCTYCEHCIPSCPVDALNIMER